MRTTYETTPADKVLMAAVALCAGALFFLMPGWVLSRGSEIEISCGDRFFGTYSLGEDCRIEIPGPRGTTTVEIAAGRARVALSPCPRGFCTHMGDIGREGGLLVCVPNEVVVRVGNHRADGLDAVTR
jgi:hypothetical protein